MSERICRGATPDHPNISYFTGREWLKSIDRQDYPDFDIYININDVSDQTYYNISNEIDEMNHVVYHNRITTGYPTDIRGGDKQRAQVAREHGQKPYEHFADMRNIILDWFLVQNKYTHLVSIDSDVIIHPEAVRVMVSCLINHPSIGMVGLPVNNSRRRSKKHAMGLTLGTAQYNFGHYTLYDKNNAANSLCTAYRSFETPMQFVDYTGACTVISSTMLRLNPEIRFGPHIQGEDIPFCWQIKKAGYSMIVLTNQSTLHMQDPFIVPMDLENFKERRLI